MFNTDLTKEEIQDKFNKKYTVDASGCWIWTGTRANKVTPQLTLRNAERTSRPAPARRISYWLVHGDFDQNGIIGNSCNNTLCVNPDHLHLTIAESKGAAKAKERVNKDQVPKGEEVWLHKLTDDQVRAIRADKTSTNKALGDQYGVSESNIWHIRKGKIWKHIK